MKVEMIKKIEVDIVTIEVDTVIRYWGDTDVDGSPDIDFYESKGIGQPRIPCAEQVKKAPDDCIYSNHWRWRPIIEIETGRILNWRKGVSARVHYKVCDEFGCIFKNSQGNVIEGYEGYVPKFMCPKTEGDGDYIIMNINTDGYIDGWNKSFIEYFFKIPTSDGYEYER